MSRDEKRSDEVSKPSSSGPAASFPEALRRAQARVKPVEKGSQNQHYRYKYASAEDIIQEARDALLAEGIGITQEQWDLSERTLGNVPVLNVHFGVFFGDVRMTTHAVVMPMIEEKGRPLDKALTTALTYSLGYFLRGLLLMPRVEEGTDVDQRRDEPAPARPPQGTTATVPIEEYLKELGVIESRIASGFPKADAEAALREAWQKRGQHYRGDDQAKAAAETKRIAAMCKTGNK